MTEPCVREYLPKEGRTQHSGGKVYLDKCTGDQKCLCCGWSGYPDKVAPSDILTYQDKRGLKRRVARGSRRDATRSGGA